jgi:hypothetical protein
VTLVVDFSLSVYMARMDAKTVATEIKAQPRAATLNGKRDVCTMLQSGFRAVGLLAARSRDGS